jgi:hypothetical protein
VLGPGDQHGAGGVADEVIRHGSEQCPPQTAAAVGAGHEDGGPQRGGEVAERRPGIALDDLQQRRVRGKLVLVP